MYGGGGGKSTGGGAVRAKSGSGGSCRTGLPTNRHKPNTAAPERQLSDSGGCSTAARVRTTPYLSVHIRTPSRGKQAFAHVTASLHERLWCWLRVSDLPAVFSAGTIVLAASPAAYTTAQQTGVRPITGVVSLSERLRYCQWLSERYQSPRYLPCRQ